MRAATRSLQARLLRLQLATMLLFVLGAAVFCWRMIVLDQSIEARFAITREVEVVQRAGALIDAVLSGRGGDAEAERQRMRAGYLRLEEPDGRTGALIHAAEKALSDNSLPRASLLAVRGEVTALSAELETKSLASEANYSGQRLWVAFAWSVILALPLALAFFPLRLSAGVIEGIHKLSEKVQAGRETGDSSLPSLHRDDEIGELGRAIDDTFAALRHREQELEVARQLRSEQEKLADLASLTGGIAHEIANPLSVILANLDVVEDGGGGGAELADMRDALERIQALLRDVTAFTSGDEHMDLVDVNSVVAGVYRIVRLDHRMRSCQFGASLDPTIPAVRFPRAALTLSLFSLLSLGASLVREAAGSMVVSSRQEDGAVSIEICCSRRNIQQIGEAGAGLSMLTLELSSTVMSMNRVLKGFGADLSVLANGDEVREYRLRIPLGTFWGGEAECT